MNESIIQEFNNKSKTLYVFFGGINARIGMPPFEFYNSAKIIEESKMFVRDFSQSWYQSGLKGISNNVLSTAKYIKAVIDELQPENVCFVGNSMGGFAAIMFSELIALKEKNVSVVAFSPQTFIAPKLRKLHSDRRWQKQIVKMQIKNLLNKEMYLDLNALLSINRAQRDINIYIGKDDALDVIHANHIANHKGVTVHTIGGGGHNVIKQLRDTNQLHQIMGINR
ncbi:alpha/beta fold hydrolase [Marinobacter sp. AL4B]|uniref:alpha/beta fold hydrolase n=1 Tax=Marinobacter sp. AL4B TaxID=2871173 RepID=UPI001CAA5C7D|nr:YqiA/YcfP family alpha/beta fold hydrolase [Marinobacter sp. AL4B]MBZ0333205.1 hypothetical protein [Marinobacter sp. AL4B]